MTAENPYRAAGTFSGRSYIERRADGELRRAIEQNQRFPYLVAPRQSGKSSLLVRTMGALEGDRFRCVLVDLSTFPLVDFDVFWRRFLMTVARGGRLPGDSIIPEYPEDTFAAWVSAIEQHLVVLIDEIDALMEAPFKEQFFSQIRSLFNLRAVRSEFSRLQFVLSGAAHPTQLIRDEFRSPFNVGVEVQLDELTREQVREISGYLRDAVSVFDDDVADRVYEHTSGSVYLTQFLLERLWDRSVQGGGRVSVTEVNNCVAEVVRDSPNNVHFVNIYQRIVRNARILEAHRLLCVDRTISEADRRELRIAGIIGSGMDPFRNDIYRRVFGPGGPLKLIPEHSAWMSGGIMAAVLEELRGALEEGDLLLFAGGGISAAAGLPTWRQLAEGVVVLMRERGLDEAAIDEARELARAQRSMEALAAAEHALGSEAFTAYVQRELDDAGRELPPIARALAGLRDRLRAVVTTNLNHLLERAFGWEALTQLTSEVASRRGIILKLHGTLDERPSWALTRERFHAKLRAPEARHAVTGLLARCPVLFVGFGRGDDSFDTMLYEFRNLSGESPPPRFALVPATSLTPFRRKSLLEMGFRLLPYDNPDGAHARALEILERIVGGAPRREVRATTKSGFAGLASWGLAGSGELELPAGPVSMAEPVVLPDVHRTQRRMSGPPATPIEVFVSYAESDRDLRDKIETHLAILKRKGAIRGWHEGEIGADDEWDKEVREQFEKAKVILLLVSADFLASDFCYDEQLRRAIERHERGEVRVVPVILDVCDWEPTPFRKLKPLPHDGRPVTLWPNQSEAFSDISRGIRRQVEAMTQHPLVGSPDVGAHPVSHSEVTAPPSVWGVPPWTGRNLAARDDLLAEIHVALAKRGIAPLCGLGGTGKTMLAVEYAHRNASAYDIVYLVPGDSAWSVLSGFAALASELRVPEQELMPDEAAGVGKSRLDLRVLSAVKNRLGRRGRWLLIFDGVRDPQMLDAYLPSVSHGGHILMTSRNPIWRGLAAVTVRGLERAESVRFLLRRTGEIDAESADALAEELGDLPLALAQAGAYIEETGRPLAEYLSLFRQRPAALLERPQSFPVTVATTWESSFAEVFQSQAAIELLSLLSFVPADELPRRALASYDPLFLDDAVAVLRLHSLIEVRPHALSVHRLVKVMVRHQLRPEERRRWMEAARRLVQNAGAVSFDDDDEGPGPISEPDLP